MILVADASAVGTFILQDEAGPFATFATFANRLCVENDVRVPSIWVAEITNLILKASRRGRLTDADRIEAVTAADGLNFVVTIHHDDFPGVIAALALDTGLSAYDATYALLCRSLNAPLLTVDGPLRRAAAELGIVVLAP